MTTSQDKSSHGGELVGSWKLLTFTGEDQATGEKQPIFGPTPKGRLVILESGLMIGVLTAAGRTPPSTDDERAKSFNSMVAYSGRYTTKDDQFTTDVDISWNEAWVGTSQVRTYRFEGSRLHLITAWAPNPFNPSAIGRAILEWERET